MIESILSEAGERIALIPAGSGRPAHSGVDPVRITRRTLTVDSGHHKVAAMAARLGGAPRDCVEWV